MDKQPAPQRNVWERWDWVWHISAYTFLGLNFALVLGANPPIERLQLFWGLSALLALWYLLKDTPPETLFRAVRSAALDEVTLAPSVAEKIARRLTAASNRTLSLREIEVLELAARGLSNKDIAGALIISEATVKSHFVHIFVKLDVTDRTAAVTVALKRKLIRLID